MAENNPRRELYTMLKEDGYYNGDYSAFTANIDKPDARRELYDMLTADGYYNGNWDSFNKKLTKTVYNPTTNRAVQIANPQNTWEQTVNNLSAGVKGAPMMLTPFGQNEWRKSSLQPDRIQKEALTPEKSKADRIIEQRNQTQPSPYKPIPTEQELINQSMPEWGDEQKQIDSAFDKTMKEAEARGHKAYEETMKNMPSTMTEEGQWIYGMLAQRRANEEVTPSKIIGAIQEQILGKPIDGGNSEGTGEIDPVAKSVNEKASNLHAQRIYNYVRDKLIEKRVPQSKWATFFRTMMSNNLLTNLIKATVMTPEQLQYESMSMSDNYNKHQLGSVAKVSANVAGVATDPTTWISGGVGNAAAQGAGRLFLNSSAKFGVNQAGRMLASKGANWLMPKIVGGAANFATFEGLGTLSGQIGSGQKIDLGEIGKSTIKGAAMGTLIPVFSNYLGKGADWTMKKVHMNPATVTGKAVRYGADFGTRTAVFAGGNIVQQWASDPHFNWETADYGEALLDAAATNLGFDLYHVVKAGIKTKGANFTQMLSKPHEDKVFKLTQDDVRTAQKCGLKVEKVNDLINAIGNMAERDAQNGKKYNTDDTAKQFGEMMNETELGQFLQNENMTQSLLCKIKNAVTGDLRLPQANNVEMREDNGKFIVTTSNNMGVVEERTFNQESEARRWMDAEKDDCRVGRVRTMEALVGSRELGRITQRAGEAVMGKYNLTHEEFVDIIRKNGELSPEEKAVRDDYDNYVKEKAKNTAYKKASETEPSDLQKIQESVAKEYGISDKDMKRIAESDYKRLNSKEQNIFRAYEQALEKETKPVDEQAKAVEEADKAIDATIDAVAKNMQVHDVVMPDTGERETLLVRSDGSGVSLSQAYEDGKSVSPETIKPSLQILGEQVQPAVKEVIDKAFEEHTVLETLERLDGNMDDATIQYVEAKMQQQGYADNVKNQTVAKAVETVRNSYGTTEGVVRKAVIGGKEVILTGKEGDEFCYYKEAGSDEVQRIEWDKVSNIQDVDVSAETATAIEQAKSAAMAEVAHKFAHEPETHTDYKADDSFYALDEKGNVKPHKVVGVDANGNVTYGVVGDNGEPKDMKTATKAQLQQMEDDAYRVRNGIVPTEESAKVEAPVAENAPVEEATANEQPVEEVKPQSYLEQIPKDKKGRPEWNKAESPEVASKALLEIYNGNEDDAISTVDAIIEGAKADVDKAGKAEVKPSSDPNDVIEQRAKIKKTKDEAAKNLKFWRDVKSKLQTAFLDGEEVAEEETANDAVNNIIEQKKNLSNKAKVDSVGLDESTTPYDYVLGWIASGAKFKWGNGEHSQGLKNETGYSSKDVAPFLLDNKNGQTPDQMAHAIYEAMPERLREQTDDMEIKDHILDIIQSFKNYKDMADEFVKRNTYDESQIEEQRPTAEQTKVEESATNNAEEIPINTEDMPFSRTEKTEEKPISQYDKDMAEMKAETEKLKAKLAEKQQRQIEKSVKAAVDEGKRLGTEIHVLNTIDDLREVLGKGYSDEDLEGVNAFKKGDEVYIYAPNMTDERFAVQQVWHEVVAHKGIKALFSEKDLNKFFADVFKYMSKGAKERFAMYVFNSLDSKERKATGFDSYKELAKDESAKKKFFEDHYEHIADEYVAREHAERGEFNRGVWQTFKDWLNHYAHKFGFADFSDSEIRYILGKSKENLQSVSAELQGIERANTAFNEQLDKFTMENANTMRLVVGNPSRTLKAAGVIDKPMILYGNKIVKKLKKHGFDVKDLSDLPKMVANPIAVFNNYGKDENRSVLTELKTKQGNILVAINVGSGQDADLNVIASAFGKGAEKVIDWFNRGYATYIDKEKALDYLHSATPIVAASNNQELYDATKVVDSFDTNKFWNDYKSKGAKNSDAKVKNTPQLQSEDSNVELSKADENVSFSKVEDKDLLKKLDKEPTVKRYRAMQVIDGKLYPPMSAKINGKLRQPTEIGVWEQADENPELAKNGKFTLNKGQKGQGSVPAAYNPYFHTSTSGLNDQFTSAYKRPELVVAEVEIPESELTSGYKAEGAKDAVGNLSWHSGVVNGKLPNDRKRTVTLSRYAKVTRIVPDKEVAQMIAKQLDGTNIEVPYNVVTPNLRNELEKAGVKISDTPAGTMPKGETRFSKREEDDKKLYGVHNLTEENLLHAVKMGGLANPSTAVVRIDRDGLNSFGDISLLMPPSMIEKKSGRNAGTWSADAYSPRYPREAVRGDMSSKGQDKFNKDIETASDNEKMRREIRDGWSQYISYNDKRDALYYWYLEDKGLTPEKVMEKPVELKSLDKAMIDATGGKDWIDLSADEKDQIKQNYVDYTVAKFEKMFRHQLESGKISEDEYKDKIAKVRKEETDGIKESGLFNLYRNAYARFKRSQKELGVDSYNTAFNARKRVQDEGLEKDFNDWLDGKKQEYEVTESVFDGFDSEGNRKYRPHTLANISKMMKKSGKAGAEELFTTSPGALRAKIAPIYGKLDDIRKNKDKIISSNEFEKIKKQISEEFFDLSALVRGKMGGDEGFYRLEEAMKHGAEWLNKNYSDIDLDKEDVERIEAFRTFLKEAPTEYFETKFERPVMLNEFVGAVVPKTMGDKARKALEEAGLKLYDYDPKIEGDRQKVIENATQENDILFSRKEREELDRKGEESVRFAIDEYKKRMKVFHGSGADFDHFDIKFLGTGEGAQAYGHGLYVTEVKGIGETYAMASAGKAKYKGKVVYSGDPYSDNPAERALFYMEQEHGRKEAIKLLREIMRDEDDADIINDYKETIKVLQDEKNWGEPERMLYTVEIPEDNGSNYLLWDKPITDKQAQTIESKLVENDIFLENSRNVYESILNGLSDKSMMPSFEEWIQDRASVIVMSGKENGQRLYKEFENMLGSDKEASEFLGSIGFVGVVYPAEYRSGGRKDGAKNYVVFDDSDLAITDKVRFSKREEQSYKAAFKNKDEEKAFDIVREAAAKTFPDTKVVDKDGKPLVVYHGTQLMEMYFKDGHPYTKYTDRFNTFMEGKGFFTDDKDAAKSFARGKQGLYEAYLDIKNPFILDCKNHDWDMIEDYENKDGYKYVTTDYIVNDIKRNHPEYDGVILRNVMSENSGSVKHPIDDYIPFKPEQIKSAEPFTYDDAGNLIPLNERFNEKSNDIRFSFTKHTDWRDEVAKGWKDRQIYDYRSKKETSDIQYEKAKDLANALAKAGYKDFYISRSITDFGVSTYIQGALGLKFRISDHSVTNTDRIFGEEHLTLATTPQSVVDIANEKQKQITSREERINAERKSEEERKQMLDEKWERIKDQFEGYYFKTNDTGTYAHFDEEISKHPNSKFLLQKSIPNNAKKWRYEWAEPLPEKPSENASFYEKAAYDTALSHGKVKPSYDFIEAWDENASDVNTTRFSMSESDGIERDELGRPIMPQFKDRAEILSPEGMAKLKEWSKEARRWDMEHPLDVKNRKAAASKVERLIKTALDDADVDEVTKAKLNSAMKAIKNTNTFNLSQMTSKGFKIAAGAINKAYEKQIHDLMMLKVRDKNGRGNAVGKKIDAITAQAMETLRGYYDKKKKRFTVDSSVIDAKIAELQDKIANSIDEGAMTDDEAMKNRAQMETLNILKRVSESNVTGTKLQELIDGGKQNEERLKELYKMKREGHMNYKDADGNTVVVDDEIASIKKMQEANDLDINAQLQAKMDALDVIKTKLADLVDDGRDYRKSKFEKEQQRRSSIVGSVMESIASDKKISQRDIDTRKYESTRNPFKMLWNASMDSFEYMCKTYATNGLTVDNFLYDYFIKGKEGVIEASNNYENAMRRHAETIEAKCQEIYGKKFLDVVEDNSKLVEHPDVYVDVDKNKRGDNTLGEQGGKREISLTKGEGTYIYMLWRMADGQAQLLRQGFTEATIEEIGEFIGKENQQFADWMQLGYLPQMREKYNDRYIEVFDTSMAHIDNYVPLRRSKMKIADKEDMTATGNGNPQVVTKGANALIERTHNTNNIDCTADAFKVLYDHLNEMEEWYNFARLRQDLQYVVGSPAVRNRMNRNNTGSFQRFVEAAKAAAHVRGGGDMAFADKAWSELAKAFTTGAIAYRYGTALKQTLSLPAFLDYSGDPKFLAKFIMNTGVEYITDAIGSLPKTVANLGVGMDERFKNRANSEALFTEGMTRNMAWCLNNIPNFYERVINQATSIDPIMNEKTDWRKTGKFGEDFFYYLSKYRDKYAKAGFAANKLVDAATCAIGAKTIYDYKYGQLMEGVKGKYEEGTEEYERARQEAHRLAVIDATLAYNSSQQSSHPAFLAPLQREKTFASKMLTLFKNSPISYSRKLSASLQDLYRIAGNTKDGNLTRYYTQRIMLDNENMSVDDARKEARKVIRNRGMKAMWGAALYGYILPWLWAQGGKGLFGLITPDEDEDKMTDKEKEQKKWEGYAETSSFFFDGVPTVMIATDIPKIWMNVSNDWSINTSNAGMQMLNDALTQGKRIYDEQGIASPQFASFVANRALKNGLGADIETWSNIALGLCNLAKDGYISAKDLVAGDDTPKTKEQAIIDLMFLLNSPRSQRIALAKDFYKDMPYEDYEYAVRVASNNFAETMPYLGWLPQSKTITEKKAKQMYDEFLRYHSKDGSAQKRAENKESVKSVNEERITNISHEKMDDYVKRSGRYEEMNELDDWLSDFSVLNAAHNTWVSLKKNDPDEADKYEEAHAKELDDYKANIGKFRRVNSVIRRFDRGGENEDVLFDEVMELLKE